MTDGKLIERYYRAHRDELVAFVEARTGQTAAAEDMVQDVFLRLLTRCQTVCEATLPALALTLCRHQVADWYRRRAVRQACALEQAHSAAAGASAAALLSVRDLTELLERQLARLPQECRRVYRLHVYDGLTASDICRETGDGYKTVEYRLGQARRHVRTALRHVS